MVQPTDPLPCPRKTRLPHFAENNSAVLSFVFRTPARPEKDGLLWIP